LRPEHKPEVYERSSGGRNPKDTAESNIKLLKKNKSVMEEIPSLALPI